MIVDEVVMGYKSIYTSVGAERGVSATWRGMSAATAHLSFIEMSGVQWRRVEFGWFPMCQVVGIQSSGKRV